VRQPSAVSSRPNPIKRLSLDDATWLTTVGRLRRTRRYDDIRAASPRSTRRPSRFTGRGVHLPSSMGPATVAVPADAVTVTLRIIDG
jgi:hypothetical protein